MVVVSRVDIIPHRHIVSKNHFCDDFVHLGVFVIDCDATGEHIPENHPLRAVSCDRFGGFRRVVALHRSCNPDELTDKLLFLFFAQTVVAPVVNYRAYHHHRAACPGKVVFRSEIGAFQGVEHSGNGPVGSLCVVFGEIGECVELRLRSDTSHLCVVAESVVGHRSFFLGRAGLGGFFDFFQNCLTFRSLHLFAKLRHIGITQIQPRMRFRRQRNRHSVRFGPYDLIILSFGLCLRKCGDDCRNGENCRENKFQNRHDYLYFLCHTCV